jgi:outer membrane protein OmpA-like peptidoglycan-associated protein
MKSNVKTIALFLAIFPLSTISVFGQKKDTKDSKDTKTSTSKKEVEAENLVENGSFEATTGKPKKLGSIDLATGWSSPTGARADLFLFSSKVPEIAVPQNCFGKEDPKDGQNYAGIDGYSYGDKRFRTYLMTKLKTPLKKGTKYCVSFSLSLAELSKYSSNNIGVHISKKPFGTDAKTSIIEKTHILHKNNKIFNAFYNWERVCGTFEADGGEKHITIGNFSNNDQTKYERNKKSEFKGTPIISAYYYIDDVIVTELEEGKKCDCDSGDEKEISTTIYSRPPFLKEDMTPKEKIEAQMSFFAQGKTMLQPNAQASLDLISDIMKKNPTIKIQITGYNDEDEKEMAKENPMFEDMDLKRVEIVERYLKDKGIATDRIVKKISGSEGENSEIQISDDDDLKKAKTRRVTYIVIE